MKVISIDFETSVGKTIHGPTFRDPNNDIYTQIWATSTEWVSVIHSKTGFKRILDKKLEDDLYYADIIIGHNIGFDLSYVWHNEAIKNFILKGGKIWDTQVVEYLLTGQQHTFSSLAELQLKYLGQKEKPSRISYLYSKGIGADKIIAKSKSCPRLFALYTKYCQLDGVTPIKIYTKQLRLAHIEGMLPIIELYNNYLLSLINMETTGIKIDIDKCEKTLQYFNEQSLKYLQEAQKLIKPFWKAPSLPSFNINSPDHKSAILFGGHIKTVEKKLVGKFKNGKDKYKNVESLIWIDGFKVPTSISTKAKKAGLYATDNAVMEKIHNKTKNPALKKYCQLQKESMMYKKAAKTYCQAFIDRSVDGLLFPNFNNTLTTTGRLSSSNPNLQNVSKRNKFGKDLHSLFVAPAGWVCCQIDFSQLEIWVSAMLSGDELLTKHLLDGTDLHIIRLQYYNTDKTYEELYKLCKIDKDPYWDKQRTYAKTVSYQMAYGAMPPKVSESTGLDIEIVETIFRKERETYPLAASFGDHVREHLETTKTFSFEKNIPASNKRGINGSKFNNGIELLPIFDKNGDISYTNENRMIGYYMSPTTHKYHFLTTGRRFGGQINQSFSFTQPKNYPMQGTAADIQGMTTAALLKTLLIKSDRIRMINEIHDSKLFYIRRDVLEQAVVWLVNTIEDVPKIFKERFNLDVSFRFPVDVECGDNFGQMEKLDLVRDNEKKCIAISK